MAGKTLIKMWNYKYVQNIKIKKTVVCMEFESNGKSSHTDFAQDMIADEIVLLYRFPTSFLSISTQLSRFVQVCFQIIAP